MFLAKARLNSDFQCHNHKQGNNKKNTKLLKPKKTKIFTTLKTINRNSQKREIKIRSKRSVTCLLFTILNERVEPGTVVHANDNVFWSESEERRLNVYGHCHRMILPDMTQG